MTGLRIVPIFPDLAGKIALVTGSSRGIGAETARYLAVNKVKVVVNGRDREALNDVVAGIKSDGGEVIGIIADCMKYDEIEEMRRDVEDRFGNVDLLVAFAGGWEARVNRRAYRAKMGCGCCYKPEIEISYSEKLSSWHEETGRWIHYPDVLQRRTHCEPVFISLFIFSSGRRDVVEEPRPAAGEV